MSLTMIKHCNACGNLAEKKDFFNNHFMKQDGRCISCVKEGKFKVIDPEKIWLGWPKDPKQILYERGWIPGVKPLPEEFTPEKIGTMILSMPDYEFLLENFEIAGHYGYGGYDEGLCCLPGCVQQDNLKKCGRCSLAKYCSVDHQRLHWKKVHKKHCKQIAAELAQLQASYQSRMPGGSSSQIQHTDQVIACKRCDSKAEVRYGKFPSYLPDPTMKPGGLMCGKCAGYFNVQLTDWVYPDPSIAQANPKHNPFERVCAQCKASNCSIKCLACDAVWYCSDTCRTAHSEKHTNKCILLQGKQAPAS
jgi:hypothetical protein